MNTSFATVINAADFSKNTTDPQRDTWTVGKMHHVIAALKGTKVAITTDKSTGHTIIGVALTGTGVRGGTPVVQFEYADNEGNTVHGSAYLWQVGMILAMDEAVSAAKWTALASYRQHVSAAIGKAQAAYAESTGRQWGTWTGDVLNSHEVYVTYTPDTGNPYYADRRGERGFWRIAIAG